MIARVSPFLALLLLACGGPSTDSPEAQPEPHSAPQDETAKGVVPPPAGTGASPTEGLDNKSLEDYRQAARAAPEDPAARLELGLVLARSGDLEAARGELQASLRLDPTSALAHEALGTLLVNTGGDADAVELFRQAVALDPEFEAAHFRLGAALARLRRFDEAIASFSEVLALNPERSEARLIRAAVHLDSGDPKAARDDLEALLRREPHNGRARLRLGEALQRLGQGDALRQYELALEAGLAPAEVAAAHLSAGNLLTEQQDFQAAMDHYRAALRLEPGLLQASYNLAGALDKLGRRDEAAEQYQRVLEREPGHHPARFFLAQTLLTLGRPDEAAGHFAEITARDPRREEARLGEAAALSVAGRHREAQERLAAGLDATPESGPLAHALARSLAANPDRTLRDGRRALELALGVFDSQKSLEHAETVAMALAQVGRFDEAARWQKELIGGAEGKADRELIEILRHNLALYEQGEACCAAD